MSKLITYESNESHIINICKRIRKLARLERLKLDLSEHRDSHNTHLFSYLDYCGVSKEKFVKDYLCNLQPYMLSRNVEQEKSDSIICVLDTLYRVSLYIKLDTTLGNELIVSFHENHKRGIAKNNNPIISGEMDKVKILADAITGGITDTNTKTLDILIPRGVINVPLSLVGELQLDGTFLVSKNAIDNAILNVCNQYIRDLYTSDLDFPSLDEVELFSALQQISFTSYGNTVFSNISVLIDNMSAQNSPLHKQSAGFALATYVEHLMLTTDQKQELIDLIRDKYSVSSQKDISKVTNMIVDIINGLDSETLIIETEQQEKSKEESANFEDVNQRRRKWR